MKENTIVSLKELIHEHLNMNVPNRNLYKCEREWFLKALDKIICFERLENSYKYLYLGKKEQ